MRMQISAGGPDGVYPIKGEDGDKFLIWLREYIRGGPKVSEEGPPATPPGCSVSSRL
jgi:hypothetical protein